MGVRSPWRGNSETRVRNPCPPWTCRRHTRSLSFSNSRRSSSHGRGGRCVVGLRREGLAERGGVGVG